jgi:hypothetical protein
VQKSERINIRVSEGEKAAWAEAAGGSRRVSEWLRALANAAAANDRVGPVEALDAAGLELGQSGIEKMIDEQRTPAGKVSIGKDNGTHPKCERWSHHRPGTYCAACGKTQ